MRPRRIPDVLGALSIGWHNGLAKKNAINVARIQDFIRDLAIHCRANKDQRVTQAIDSSGTDNRASSASQSRRHDRQRPGAAGNGVTGHPRALVRL